MPQLLLMDYASGDVTRELAQQVKEQTKRVARAIVVSNGVAALVAGTLAFAAGRLA